MVTGGWFTASGTQLVTESVDQTARVWDAATGKELPGPPGHRASKIASTVGVGGCQILAWSEGGTARVWEPLSGKEIPIPSNCDKWVLSASVTAAGARIVTRFDGQRPRVWDASSGIMLAQLIGHEAQVSAAAFHLQMDYVLQPRRWTILLPDMGCSERKPSRSPSLPQGWLALRCVQLRRRSPGDRLRGRDGKCGIW